jgi:branched-chain amino acid transport system substrate-binding protein
MFRRSFASAASGAEGRGAAVKRPEPGWAWRGVAVLSVAALVLTACGDGDDGEEPTGGGGEPFESTFTLGAILPQTGGLATFGEGMIAAVEMAVQEINENGGVWGNDIELLIRDEGPAEEPEVVQSAADEMVSQQVNAVIGAASSTSSLNIIETLYNQRIIQVSPSNTGPDFTGHEFGEYYFRTAPSDVLQGDVLANVILEDGHQSIAILGQQTAYGEGLSNQIAEVFQAGGGQVLAQEFYDLAQTEYSSEARAMANANADATVLVSYEEARQIIPALVSAGVGPQDTPLYLVDGNNLDYSEDFNEGLMQGAKATTPGSEEEPTEFFARVDEFRPGLPERVYVPESYDATVIVALAAIAANTDDPDAIKDQMLQVVQDGTACTTFVECRDLLADGTDIDYNGVTGPISWTEEGDPGEATIGVFEYGPDNTSTRIESRVGQM